MPPVEKSVVDELEKLEIGIATGLGAKKTKFGADGKVEALAFTRSCFRYGLLFVLVALSLVSAYVVHSRFVITVTSRDAYDRERLHRHEGHHCAARLIQVENTLEAKYEEDHHRSLLAKSYHERNKQAYDELNSDVKALVESETFKTSMTAVPEFREQLDSIIADHVLKGQHRGRNLWKSIIEDEKDAVEHEKSLQKHIQEDLETEQKDSKDFAAIHDSHYGETGSTTDRKWDSEGSSHGALGGEHDHDESDDELSTKGELSKMAKNFFENLQKYWNHYLARIRVDKKDALYTRLRGGALKLLNGKHTNSDMVGVLTNSTQDFKAAGLVPYNRTKDGGAADFLYKVIQKLTLHTYMPRLKRLEQNFTSGIISGAEVLQALEKLQAKNVVPAELFHSVDAAADKPDGENLGDASDDAPSEDDDTPFDKMETPKYELPSLDESDIDNAHDGSDDDADDADNNGDFGAKTSPAAADSSPAAAYPNVDSRPSVDDADDAESNADEQVDS